MANKETRIFKSNTFEEFRQKTNDVSLYLGDNEQLNVSLSDKTFNYDNVSAGTTILTGLDVLNKTQQFNIKTEQTIDNTGGYIILTGSPSITGFVSDATITQTGGYSATIVSATSEKILVKHSSGSFDSSSNISVGGDTILAANVVRITAEAYHVGVVRVYVNGTEINQDMNAGGFHVPNYKGTIPLLNSPTVSGFTVGSTIYQGANLGVATFSGTVLSVSSTELRLKNYTGSFSPTTQIKVDGSGSTISGANHGALTNIDDTFGNAIELNTPSAAGDDIKVYSPSIVDAVNELQDDVGITENLTTVSGNLVGAVNEIEAVFDASTHEISAGTNPFDVTSGEFTLDSSADIVLDADGGNVELKDGGTQYGSLTSNGSNIVVKSGSTTMLSGSGADATFANDVTVSRDVDIDRNLNVDGTTELNSTLGVDGNFRVGSSNSSKFDVAAATGNTQIDGTLEVDGTAGIDGNLRVGSNKFNVTASSGNTQIDGTLEVDGTAGVDGNFRVGSSGGDKFNVTASSGNTQIDGTLNVDSTTTLNGTTIDGNLDLNGSVDVSTNATIHGVLDVDGVSNLDVVDIDGAVDMALTLQVDGNTTIDGVLDIGQLNALFTNRNDVKLALNELHTEVGSAQIGLVSGLAADGQSNMTNAINIIDAEIGTVSSYEGGTYGSTTISGVLTNLQTGMINNDTDITNLFADVGSLVLVDNLPTDYTYTITDLTTATNTMSGFIGSTSIADIGTTDTVTGAIQKLHAEIGDSDLAVFTATDISGALRELETEKVYLTSSTQQEISSKLGLTGNVTFKDGGNNADTMTFNSGTTLDLSNASLLLPGNASNVNIFSTSFLEVDGNVQIQGFSVDRQHVATITDKADVRLQWNENHADGTSTTKPARSWQFVGLDDTAASHTTDIVTFYNAKELIASNTESGINVTWDSTNENFDFNVNDPTVQLSGDVIGSAVMTNLGSINISTTIQPNSVALGTDTTGDYIRKISGTTNQITVSPAAHSESKDATLSIPNDFRMPGTAKVLGTTGSSSATTGALTVAGGVGIGEDLYIAGNLYVEGTRTELNVTTLEVEDTLILAGNNLSSEPSSGGFGIETGPITNPSGVASNITGAHSIVYNYGTDRWEADGSLILSEATLGSPTVEGNTFGSSNNLDFVNGSGISVTTGTSGNDIDVTIANSDRGSSQAIFKNFTAGSGGTATANINNDTINFPNGSQIDTVRSGDSIIINHANTSNLNGTYGQAGAEDGTYIKSVTVDHNGHMTGVTSDDFDDRYDYYGSWQLFVNNVSQDSITSGERLGFDEGTGIDLAWDGNDITISHQDTSSVNNLTENHSGNTFIQDLAFTFDTFGHVTGATATEATVSIGNGTLTLTGGGGITTAIGDFTANQSSNETLTISHADTSNQGSVDNSGRTYIQDVTLDTYGHVTGLVSATETYTYTHPAYNGDDISIDTGALTGATVISDLDFNVTTNALGHVEDANGTFSTRNLTLADLGYTGATNADYFGHWYAYANGVTSTITSGDILSFVGGTAIDVYHTVNSDQITFNHADTSNQASVNNSGNTFIQDITLDSMGHVTGLGSGTVSIGNGTVTVTPGYGMKVNNSLSTSQAFSMDQSNSETITLSVNGTDAATASTIAVRDDSGDIHARLFRSEYDTTNASIGYIMTQVDTASNNYIRPSTAAQIRSFLNVANGANNSSNDTGTPAILSNGSTPSLNSGISAAEVRSLIGAGTATVNDTGTPAILSNGSTPSLNSGISAAEVRSIIGAGTSSSDTTYSEGGGIDINGSNVISVESDQINHIYKMGSSSAGGVYVDMQNTGYANIMSGSSIEFKLSASGQFQAEGDIIAFASLGNSDIKLKENIQKVEGALELVSQLDGVTFDWKDKERGSSAGVIAQNVEEVLPSAVRDVETLNSDDTHKAVDYNQLSALFIEAIKELKEENKLLRSELENLKSINR